MLLLGDPERDVREAVDKVSQILDLGIGQLALVAEDLTASGNSKHYILGR